MKLVILGLAAGLLVVPARACDLHGGFGADDGGYGPRSWLTDEERAMERRLAIAEARAALATHFRALTGRETQARGSPPSADGSASEQARATAAAEPGPGPRSGFGDRRP